MTRVLVTGGSLGIGLAVAQTLAARGDELILVARGEAALRAALDTLPGSGHRSCALDVSDEQAWAAVPLDALDGLVCAAAVVTPIGAIGDYDPSEFMRTLEINVLGTLLAVRHCLPALRRGSGSVVTFGGGGATSPLPRFDAYAASKAAVVRLTENLSSVIAPLKVNCVAPGFVATRLHDATLAAGRERAGAEYYDKTRVTVDAGGFPGDRSGGARRDAARRRAVHRQADLGAVGCLARSGVPRAACGRAGSRHAAADRRIDVRARSATRCDFDRAAAEPARHYLTSPTGGSSTVAPSPF